MHYGTNYKITSKYKPKKRQFVKKKNTCEKSCGVL